MYVKTVRSRRGEGGLSGMQQVEVHKLCQPRSETDVMICENDMYVDIHTHNTLRQYLS